MIIVMIKNEINIRQSVLPELSCVISDSGKIAKFKDHRLIYSGVYPYLIKKFAPDWCGWKSCFIEFEQNGKYVGLYVPEERWKPFDINVKTFLFKNSTLRPTGVRRFDPSVNIDYCLRLIVLQSLDLPKDFSWKCFLKEFKETVGIET